MQEDEVRKVKWYQKISSSIFAKFFGFEQGIDITNDTEVLHRRNVVIKNIVFVSNIFYTILLFLLSVTSGKTTDWIITVVSFPITFGINKLLKILINLDKNDETKQQIAMYVASLYIFFSAVLIYVKLYNLSSFETVAYVLIYYAIVLISLYQDKRLLANSYLFLLIILTFIHIVWTYKIVDVAQGFTMMGFFKYFTTTDQFWDLILRTVVFSLFFLVVIVIVSIGQYMQEERKKELIKRRQVQDDFSLIVGNLFNAVFNNSYISINVEHSYNVQKMASKIASLVSMDKDEIKELGEFAIISLKNDDIRGFASLAKSAYDDKIYDKLKEKTKMGVLIVERIELAQVSEKIIRAITFGSLNDNMMKLIIENHKSLRSQIILLSDLYLILRKPEDYKRPYNHKMAVDQLEEKLGMYFNYELINRFIKFNHEIEELYNSL
ncbi:hypothetical protein [Haploplasma modicum]|uniref:hypothetical protein n=1 Tax=Haploplasma modicum TaxID=2150 RepID=UPI00047E925B|nr:hypothetical protein [Haploplasma modicum]